MVTMRRSEERGHFNHGWLDTFHTFSFGDYNDPAHRGFSCLRVINEDRIAPAQGFGTHGHADMEIVTYVLSGELSHKDSMGNGSAIKAGDVQYMSAGSGVTHSEFNASQSETCHLLQIWIKPNEKSATPRYGQKQFASSEKRSRWRPLVSGDGKEGSIVIRQDAVLSATLLKDGEKLQIKLDPMRSYWLHIVRGECAMGKAELKAGDAAGFTRENSMEIQSKSAELEALLFDLPTV
jgi:quercetin 2,3-dioxygenase